jgi:ABC-type multidrug transport system permease subunit
MIAALTVSAAISTFFYDIINLADNYDNLATSLLIIAWGLLLVFTIIGIAVFVYLYPFHLLRVDYKNKVMSLMFASGVSRTHYYFVKIGATILTCLAAAMIILFVPLVTLLVFRQNLFVDFIRFVFDMFQNEDILSLFLDCIVALLASLVT